MAKLNIDTLSLADEVVRLRREVAAWEQAVKEQDEADHLVFSGLTCVRIRHRQKALVIAAEGATNAK